MQYFKQNIVDVMFWARYCEQDVVSKILLMQYFKQNIVDVIFWARYCFAIFQAKYCWCDILSKILLMQYLKQNILSNILSQLLLVCENNLWKSHVAPSPGNLICRQKSVTNGPHTTFPFLLLILPKNSKCCKQSNTSGKDPFCSGIFNKFIQ